MKFLELFRQYILFHEKAANVFDKRHKFTIRIYRNRYDIVSEFLHNEDLQNLEAENFTIRLAKKYFEHLCHRYKHNYAVRLVEVCSAVLQYGAINEVIKYNPLQPYKLKRISPERPIFLSETELLAMEEYCPKSSLKQKAKDMFLFQCYTGMDYGDIITVTRLNIALHKGRYFIIKRRNKTSVDAIIPYTDKAKLLFEKHNFKMNLLCNAVYNRYLKFIAEDLEINKHLTTHIGRKTYAMLKLNYEGYSIEGVSKMIGHKKISTTEMYYAQVEIDLICKELDRLGA